MNYFNWNCRISTQSLGCGHSDICFTDNTLFSFAWGLPSIDFTATPLWSDSAELQDLFFGAEIPLGLVSDAKVAVSILVLSDGGGPNTALSIYTSLLTGIVLPSGLLFTHILSSEMWYQSIAQRLQNNCTEFFFFTLWKKVFPQCDKYWAWFLLRLQIANYLIINYLSTCLFCHEVKLCEQDRITH